MLRPGDLVKLKTGDDSTMWWGRLGIVVELRGPTAVVQWIGIEGTMVFRVKSLEVVSESR